ncbi:phage holin [Clostridium saccharobutylicum]|nr:phage holin [Clostridium saccharobutylicum]AQR90844.1 bacteriophage holin [Clostridium saccharobutylicum]AQS00748.1 bacteriophage holin [Clostridium saccharobutylicum]AQS10410.1 bacteriophage holin [Clostridium saccharobutylicum]AQS14731.1 bacteriophage holin [Clostridium saccharobutylicum]MBA2906005.1 phi LC3 family holin [Clostridium saccharobutylicum]
MEMLNIDLKARLKNKAFWVSMVSAIALLVQQLGLQLPSDYSAVVNAILTILTMSGIIVDTSTPGISDQTTTSTNSTENKTK